MAISGSQDDKLHGVPRRGYVLSSAVEEIAQHGRVIVSNLSSAFQKDKWAADPFVWCANGVSADRAAWHVLAVWLTRQTKCPNISLRDAIAWYLGAPMKGCWADFWHEQDVSLTENLHAISSCSGHLELLPYVLESHGPGSRLSVMRNPATKAARTTKKLAGVFYTPPDVANFIAHSLMDMIPFGRDPQVLDPAVGTGVFLRACLLELQKRQPNANSFLLARDCLFGLDVDPLALDGAASVLLCDTVLDAELVNDSPIMAWRELRKNLVCCDTLTVDKTDQPEAYSRTSIKNIFPSISLGFDIIIGNPPYAELGDRDDLTELAQTFATLPAAPSLKADLYPVFVEQMVRLAAPGAVGGMVLPLSIACNSRGQFSACRKFIEEQIGSWKFSFFDRQPHALFGEDIKTRNAIFLWNSAELPSVQTGPLRRWRGDDRAAMLSQINYTPVSTSLAPGIPKFHGSLQGEVWEKICSIKKNLNGLIATSGPANLSSVSTGTDRDVYIAPTAYNFIGIARPLSLCLAPEEVLSENALHKISCGDAVVARAVYAILGSNFAYWWWLTIGDGFHVNRATLLSMPTGFDTHESDLIDSLSILGNSLWEASCKQPIRSVNRGRVSLNFTPDIAPEQRRNIDRYLCTAMSLPNEFVDELSMFTKTMQGARLLGGPNQERLKELAA